MHTGSTALALERDALRAALKAAAIIIETKAPTTIEGVLCDPWDDLLQYIEAVLEGKDTQPRLAILRRAIGQPTSPKED